MRKLLLTAFAVLASAGLSLAEEVTFVSYDKDKKALKVKEGTAEKVYTLTDKTVFKNGDKEIKKQENGFTRLEKLKADAKFEITADKETVSEIKFAAKKDK
jgi:hypothetical protein